MTTWTVRGFPRAEVSADGLDITMHVDLGAGRRGKLVLPFSELDWLQQAMSSLVLDAHDRQVASGRLAPSVNALRAEDCESVRVMTGTTTKTVLIQMSLRRDAGEPACLRSITIEPELALELAGYLCESAARLRQSDRPT